MTFSGNKVCVQGWSILMGWGYKNSRITKLKAYIRENPEDKICPLHRPENDRRGSTKVPRGELHMMFCMLGWFVQITFQNIHQMVDDYISRLG
jgi:hypothetical protein